MFVFEECDQLTNPDQLCWLQNIGLNFGSLTEEIICANTTFIIVTNLIIVILIMSLGVIVD